MKKPKTVGELRSSRFSSERHSGRRVRDEIRENLIRKIKAGEELFPGIVGYEETVIPQLINALLSRHHFVLLGLRGQAKSRILRGLVRFLDEEIPVLEGCEIHDDPYTPICRACKLKVAELGDEAPIAWLSREARYVEKLATPDVTIADIIGDLDPIRAARGGLELSDELTIHFGLLPHAHRGIFSINELPDLAGKIQVGLFNILQEGDVQIKGYPVRLPLDVLMAFTANPEDYTARGKIITPLKDRIGAEIRTHYPNTLEQGVAITRTEAWTARRQGSAPLIPDYIREIIEEIAAQARKNRRVDRRSGVSQRLPITALETAVSNAEQRALTVDDGATVVRVTDVYASLPAITGKMELEYEGELKGAHTVAHDLIGAAVGRIFQKYFSESGLESVVEWFEMGGYLKMSEATPAGEALAVMKKIPGLVESTAVLGVTDGKPAAVAVAAAELVLEGLAGVKKISRSRELGFHRRERPQSEIGREPSEATKQHLN